jgi:hypothetical protein
MRVWIVIFLSLCLCLISGGTVLAYEEPVYNTLKTYEEFELRQYESFIIAEVHVTGGFDDVGNKAFRKLFNYISNADRPQGKIDMTTPVIQQPMEISGDTNTDNAKKAQEKGYRFAFVMPGKYELEDLPPPLDPAIQLKTVPGNLIAARRYSGTWSQERYQKNEQILLQAIKGSDYKAAGEPIFARYNAPFSLWFLRRNEVLVPVEKK